MHTSHELEHLFLLWKSADAAFSGKSITSVRECAFHSQRSLSWSYLVEGGRWLLTVGSGGAVTYYDLDAESITGTSLIPALINPGPQHKVAMSVDYDIQSPMFKFNIALYLSDYLPKPHCKMFQIWSVSLVLDPSHHGVGLVAKSLAMFPLHRQIIAVHSISLLGPHLVFTAKNSDPKHDHVFIVRWMHGIRQSDIYPLRMLQRIPLEIVSLLKSC